MVRHIVCYKLKDPTDEVKQKTKEIFLSMQGRVPEVKSVTVGIDELHSERSFAFEAMASYQRNDYHVSVVKKHVHSVKESSVSVDYSMPDRE